jgi:arginase
MRVQFIRVPYDSGFANARMGRGPAVLEVAARAALGNDRSIPASRVVTLRDANVPEVQAAFTIQRELAAHVAEVRQSGDLPIVLAGNCNTSTGTLAGLRTAGVTAPAVCWFDAHADYHTPETTGSGFLDGMALSMLTGRCWRTMLSGLPGYSPVDGNSIVMLGVRDVDPEERTPLEQSGITMVPANDRPALASALRKFSHRDIYLHLDVDAIDIREGRANGYACAGGYSAAELSAAVSMIGAASRIAALCLSAYDPSCDASGTIAAIAAAALRVVVNSASSPVA